MIKRVLVAPLNYSHEQEGQLEAFEQVFGSRSVINFDFMSESRSGLSNEHISRNLVQEACDTKPDWIWLQVQGSNVIQPWTIEQVKKELPKTIVSHWMGDLRTELPVDLIEMCRVTDLTLISNMGQIPFYQQYAKRVTYCQIGLDWRQDVLGLPDWTPPFRVPDVVFIGGYYEGRFPGAQLRLDAIRRLMAEKIDVGVIGPGWPSDIPIIGECTVKQSHHVYKRAKIALSINNYNDVESYYSDRQLIAMASGTPVVCKLVPGLTDEFVNGAECAMFTDLDLMVVLVQQLLDNADLRSRIGTAGRQIVMQKHSWYSRILEILPLVEEARASL